MVENLFTDVLMDANWYETNHSIHESAPCFHRDQGGRVGFKSGIFKNLDKNNTLIDMKRITPSTSLLPAFTEIRVGEWVSKEK